MRDLVMLVARILMSIIFWLAGIGKIRNFNGTAGMMAGLGIPMAKIALIVAIIIELVGGLMLLLGIRARLVGWVLFLYLIPVSVTMHNFWAASGPQAANQQIHFLKNLAIMGGMLYVA